MTTLKTVMIAAALIAGGTSLAMAQAQGSSGPDGQAQGSSGRDGMTPAAGAADNPPAQGHASGRTARHHGTTHHRMYMQSGSTAANAAASGGSGTHRGALKTGSAASNQKVLYNQNGYR